MITMLIVGPRLSAYFNSAARLGSGGPGRAPIEKYHHKGSMVLVDGTGRTEQYNVRLPSQSASGFLTSDISPQTSADICFGYVSVIVVRMTGHRYANPADKKIEPIINSMYRRKVVIGKGGRQPRSMR